MRQTHSDPAAPGCYFERLFGLEAARILPGEYYVASRRMVLVTVLGSCVSACIRDRRLGVGGMNHFMLPGQGDTGVVGAGARYGAYAMEILLNQLAKAGARRADLEAKVFGGGRVLSGKSGLGVGERNGRFVLEYLATERIRVAAQDLAGVWPRKIYYFPHSGRVLVKKLRSAPEDALLSREREYGRRLESEPLAGDIELFD